MNIKLIDDFSHPLFQSAFKTYFADMGISVKNWDAMFQSMNTEQGNVAYLMEVDNTCIGFIQFRVDTFSHWFFEADFGFIREFWIDAANRKKGLGKVLIAQAEAYFKDKGLHHVILTSDSAADFYVKNGYRLEPKIKAKNEDPVYSKRIG